MQGQLTITLNVAGLKVNGLATRNEEGIIGQEVPLPAGNAGALTTRTGDDVGVATVAEGHGVTTDDVVDIYWDGGVRYGCTVTAKDTTTITVGADTETGGDVLPEQDTAIVVTARVEIAVGFDGDELTLLAAGCDQRAHVDWHTVEDVSIAAAELPAQEAWSWVAAQGITNPLAGGVVAKIQASCGSGTTATTLTVAGLYNSI